jgi:hypothetical protein
VTAALLHSRSPTRGEARCSNSTLNLPLVTVIFTFLPDVAILRIHAFVESKVNVTVGEGKKQTPGKGEVAKLLTELVSPPLPWSGRACLVEVALPQGKINRVFRLILANTGEGRADIGEQSVDVGRQGLHADGCPKAN